MVRVAVRGLAGRKLRAVLTAIAIVLGVAMISGTYILTDTVQRAFNNLLVDSYAGTDAVVTGKGLDISIDGEQPPPPPVDTSLLDVVRGLAAAPTARAACVAAGVPADQVGRYTVALASLVDGDMIVRRTTDPSGDAP